MFIIYTENNAWLRGAQQHLSENDVADKTAECSHFLFEVCSLNRVCLPSLKATGAKLCWRMYGALIRALLVLAFFSAFCLVFVECSFKIRCKKERSECRMTGEQKHTQPLREGRKGHIEPFVKRKGRNCTYQKVQKRKVRVRNQVASLKKHGKSEGKGNTVARDALR